ncbi:hypothetical protein JCM30237_08270 [Halolamina litorea]|uniref:BGTF surface domain-containing protein n=1 Tax=Halolamina litorea TaxID=1515593 RepID=A0ABD6BS17_9EURY|nr:BGTF surface domain-containing protein [Halolamina litorea]
MFRPRTVLLVTLLLFAPAASATAAAVDARPVPAIDGGFSDDTVTNGQSGSTTTLDIDTDANTVRITATRDGQPVPADTLVGILGGDGLVGTRDREAEYTVPGDGASFRAEFAEKRPGVYNLTVRGDDGETATASVTVFSVGYTFTVANSATGRGGIAEITIDTPGPEDHGTLVVGSGDAGYRATVAFADGGDDRVTVRFNTFAAGNDSLNVVDAGNASDQVRVVNQSERPTLLAPGVYRLTVWSGNDSETVPERASFSTLTIGERGEPPAQNVSLAAAPASLPRSAASDVAGPTGPDDAVAMSDWTVLDLRGPAVEGIVDAYGGLGAAAASSALRLEVEQTNPTPSCARRELVLGETDPTLDANRSTLLLRASTTEFDADGAPNGACQAEPRAGDRYAVRFAVTDDRLVDAPNETVREFGFVEGGASLSPADRTVTPGENVTLSGNTTYAPGTTFRVAVSSVENATPGFERRTTARVGSDGRWSATFDLSARAPGERVVVRSIRFNGALHANASVVARSTTTPTPTVTLTPTANPTATPPLSPSPTTSPTASRTTPETPSVAETPTRTRVPGLGVHAALLALIGGGLASRER